MSATTVHVSQISSKTSEKEVKDFFSFCGKIASIDIVPSGDTKKATVTFEKPTAAKTALLLDNTALGASQVRVSSASGATSDEGAQYTPNEQRDSDEITQEEKPRSRIIAEYLAHGYVIGDQAVQTAIDLDQKHGVTNRFLSTLQQLDSKLHATDKAKSVDQSYGVTQKTNSLLSGLNSYYEKAVGTPTGKKVAGFYTQTSRQVQDIHAEARRLADIEKEKLSCECGSNSKNCPCSPGKCACDGCDKSDAKGVSEGKTKCDCAGKSEKCHCPAGQCTCKSCPKAETKAKAVPGSEKTVCNCGGNAGKCSCPPGRCSCNSCAKANKNIPQAGGESYSEKALGK